ncbi:MAG: ABC transporter permease [Armatimonadota bacterium]|nr:ABC transporter permease [Armatimonadota bacterium]MDR7464557.1 ABC transporter permease [Armatimonadota bacterium]MDR7469547.1 ABC transporter permease [Armatimonadota bacterium]MDR7473445.1 ABC transporter permease [Armatimonadota bacterium]MDR7540246.1 ABC transporter permease [Armatimonadota bacterium]
MTVFIARRLLLLPLVGIGVTLLIFSLLQLLSPQQRAALYVTDPRQLQAIDSIIREHGLDRPVYIQYVQWLGRVLQGDLGWSETAKMPVARAITTFFPATLELTLYTFLPILALGIWLGTKSAVHRDQIVDHFSRLFAIGGQSFPTFVWGLLLLMIFYGAWRLFPPGRLSLEANLVVLDPAQFRTYTHLVTVDALLNGKLWIFLDALRHLALPVITLSLVQTATLVRVTRSSMLETLRQDYVRTARAKGLEEPRVINKHARKNALIPVITLSALLFVGLLNGVVITETIYNYPGIGRWGANAAIQLDAPAVAGFALFSALLLVLGNLAADILYAWIDPRIRLG